jgi:hypothetical protein
MITHCRPRKIYSTTKEEIDSTCSPARSGLYDKMRRCSYLALGRDEMKKGA